MTKRPGWDYGYRSACCLAPIRNGRKKIKNTNQTVLIWICCRCKKRDVQLIDLNTLVAKGSSENSRYESNFIPDEPEDFHE